MPSRHTELEGPGVTSDEASPSLSMRFLICQIKAVIIGRVPGRHPSCPWLRVLGGSVSWGPYVRVSG